MKNSYNKRSWNQYNKNLINRGSITFWFSKDSIKKWKAKKNKKHFGRPFLYSDSAILPAHTIRYVYNLFLRALEGFLSSMFNILKLCLNNPRMLLVILKYAEEQIDLTFLHSSKIENV